MRGTEDSDTRLDMERALARLTAKQRRALSLRLQGYTQAEIAAALGVRRTAIGMRLIRACAALRAQT